MNIITPIHTIGDALNQGYYRIIMASHVLTRLYGVVFEESWSVHAKREELQALGHASLLHH